MTDNRTSEPNKYAGYLARQEHQRDRWRGIGVKCLCGKLFDLDADHAMHQVDEIMRAALVAAAGVAPPAPSEYAYCPIHGDLLAANRSYRCGNAPTGHEYVYWDGDEVVATERMEDDSSYDVRSTREPTKI